LFALPVAAIMLAFAWFTNENATASLVDQAHNTVEKYEKEIRDLDSRNWWDHWKENYAVSRYNVFFLQSTDVTEAELAEIQNGETYAAVGVKGPFAERFVSGDSRETILLVNYNENVLSRFEEDRQRNRLVILGLTALLSVLAGVRPVKWDMGKSKSWNDDNDYSTVAQLSMPWH